MPASGWRPSQPGSGKIQERIAAASSPETHPPGIIHMKEMPHAWPNSSLLKVISQPQTMLTAAPASTDRGPQRGSSTPASTIMPSVPGKPPVDLFITSYRLP